MTHPQTEQLLSHCAEPERGCFASDPDALEAMIYYGDSVITADMRSVAAAATEAGIAGIPFEDIAYAPARLDILSMETTVGINGKEIEYANGRVGTSETLERIEEPAEDATDVERMKYRVARSAYACGSCAIGCPIRTPS